MTLFQQFGIDLEYLRISKPKHALWTWQLLIFTIAFDLSRYDLPSNEASSECPRVWDKPKQEQVTWDSWKAAADTMEI